MPEETTNTEEALNYFIDPDTKDKLDAKTGEVIDKASELLDTLEKAEGFIDSKLEKVKEAVTKAEEMATKLETQGTEELGVAGNIAKEIDELEADLETTKEELEYPNIDGAIEDLKAQIKEELSSLKEMVPKLELPVDNLLSKLDGEFSFDKLAEELQIELPETPGEPPSLQGAVGDLTKFATEKMQQLGVSVQNPIQDALNQVNNAAEAAASGDISGAIDSAKAAGDSLEQSLENTKKAVQDYNNNGNPGVAALASSMDAQLTSMGEKFGLPGDKLINLKNDILEGKIDESNINKIVENIQLDPDGDIIILGTEITSPSEDAKKGIDDLKEVILDLKEVRAKIESDISSEEQLQSELEEIAAKIGEVLKA